MTAALRSYARQSAQRYGIDPDLFERQIDQESGFNAGAVSPSGAQGIAQFMPGTAASVGLSNPFDPYAALDAAARLMADYQQQFGSFDNALIAYNAGPGAVGTGDIPQETQDYLFHITGTIGGGKKKSKDSEVGVINALLASLMESQPEPGDFKDQVQNGVMVYSAAEQYQDALSGWMQSMQDAVKLKQSYAEEESGMWRMEDGSIITRDMMDQLDPASRAQVESYIANKNIERDNAFNQLLNELNLTEFTTGQNSAISENSRRSKDFQNQLEAYREGISLDQANQNTAVRKVDRQLSGMQEASSRAATTLEALMKAAPWGTSGGKTSFTPADLGGAVTTLARFGGVGANDPLLNFTGTLNVDPNSMFNFYDQQLGVSGPLPQIPDLQTTPGQIPLPPSSIPIQQGSPSFIRPQPPVPTPMPQGTPPPPPDQIANDIMRSILSLYGGMLGR